MIISEINVHESFRSEISILVTVNNQTWPVP